MIAVLRSELYRTLTIRSSWVSFAGFAFLGAATGWFSEEFWSLFAGLGAFGVAVVVTSQHYQHRTAVLLFLGQPRRLWVLASQCVSAAVIGVVLAAASGVAVLGPEPTQYRSTVMMAPVIAVFGVANATVVRRPLWLLIGYGGWLILVEGVIGRLESPLPFTSFLMACTGDVRALLAFLGWTGAALVAAIWSIRRDLTAD